jgi:hypothetical protein
VFPLGQVLDFMREHGHRFPPEVAQVHAAWHAKIVAADLERPYWDRHTPEGREAAEADRLLARRRFQLQKRKRPMKISRSEANGVSGFRVKDKRVICFQAND